MGADARRSPAKSAFRNAAVAAILSGLAALCLSSPATAQQPQGGFASSLAGRTQTDQNANMVVKAREMIYDNDHDTVTAVGDVQIYYSGRALQADRVVYDRKSSRVQAVGNVQITEADGTVSYADSFDLTDDFRDGFVRSLLVRTVDRTRLAAARAERIEGNVTIFENGVYTACEPCLEHPEKPPFWQVKAARIIHNDQEKMIYFEDAHLEFYGVPIAYLPYLSSPDPSVKRKSGVLTPSYFGTSELGIGVEVPYFFALAPNYDLTLTPGVTTRQGPTMKGEWRHRLLTGAYMIRAAGAFQANPDVFPSTSNERFRGMIQTSGEFWLNDKWRWGWDATVPSDRFFLDDYSIPTPSRYDVSSSIYLTGQGTKSWFDARSIYFLGLTKNDVQAQLPIIHPVIDYNYIVDHPVLGGELGWDFNLTSLTREDAAFDQIANFGNPLVLCNGLTTISTPRNSCVQRGIDGSYTRLSADVYWKRTLTDTIGEQWTPFAYLRGDLAWTDLDTNETPVQFVDANQAFLARGLPAIGLDYRYPFMAEMSWGTQVIEPIGQIILRPRLQQTGQLPNEDAQSLVYDDTNLFEWDKFSGYDRIEDGSRANLGMQYTLSTHGGGYYNAMFGQSYSLFGDNPYEHPDMTNIALDSGLDTTVADYVARVSAQPISALTFSSSMRFDHDSMALRRLEINAMGTVGRLSSTVIYGRFDAQPELGLERREGIFNRTSYKLTDRWTANGGAIYDLDEHKFATAFVGMSYLDECFGMGVNLSREYTQAGNNEPVTKVMFQLSLRTLGDVNFSQSFGNSNSNVTQ
jgi:LPS-assembly protein